MKYTVMHKNIEVADIDIDEEVGVIRKVNKLYDKKHLPLGIDVKKGIVDRAALNEWWKNRSIPDSRSGVKTALEKLGVPNTQVLLLRCNGLSLSDQYWIRPDGSGAKWKDINFFENDFSEDVGHILVGHDIKGRKIDYSSPDNSSDGFLEKRWIIENGTRKLLKSGSSPFRQQPFCEVIASSVMDRLGIPHVKYSIVWDNGKPYSICDDFITKETELVTAWYVSKTRKQDNSTSAYRHLLNCCDTLGTRNAVHSIDQMLVLDYIIANEDRHMNNFGFVRDANTLEWIGFAPIYDSGSSLGYDKLTSQIISGSNVQCKPFKKTHEEQIKLVSSFDWVNFDALDGVEDEIRDILSSAGEYADETRTNAIVYTVKKRIGELESLAMEKRNIIDNIEDDVAEDIAENYGMKFDM